MAEDGTAREAKLTQYLTEAYAKEKELETALQAHIGMTTRPPYKKRLQAHLRETKGHAKQLERRIKQVSGSGPSLTAKAMRLVATAKGPLHMVRGSSEPEKMLKNVKTEYAQEHEEIATYKAIEVLAESLKDADTAKLARSIRRDEERMAKFLESQIGPLTKAVVAEEVPASERRPSGSRSGGSKSSRSRSGGSMGSRSRSGGSKSSRSRSGGSSSSRSRSGGASRGRARASSRGKS
ncbi:MAG: YciE/YciF ferroxidase family protein [Solirubrobacterales bacterium]